MSVANAPVFARLPRICFHKTLTIITQVELLLAVNASNWDINSLKTNH